MTGGEIEIRDFRGEDTDALVATLDAVFGEYGMRFDPDGYDRDVRDVFARYAPPDGVFYTAEREGRAIGFAGADVPRSDTAELHRLYLHPDARGHGLGGVLVRHVEEWARGRGVTQVELWSDVRFFHAHLMYARLGYRLFGQRQLQDPDRSIEFGFRRGLEQKPTPVVHDLAAAKSLALGPILETPRGHWARMVASGILDSRTIVSAGRMTEGGHDLPCPSDLFARSKPDELTLLELELETPVIAGFERGRERRPHPLFGQNIL